MAAHVEQAPAVPLFPDASHVRHVLEKVSGVDQDMVHPSLVAELRGTDAVNVARSRAQAKEEFSRQKGCLMDLETKKRLLERLLSGGDLKPTAEDVAAAEALADAGKADARAAKTQSHDMRSRIVDLARTIAALRRDLDAEARALRDAFAARESAFARHTAARAAAVEVESRLENLAQDLNDRDRQLAQAIADADTAKSALAEQRQQRTAWGRSLEEARAECAAAEAERAACEEGVHASRQASSASQRHLHIMSAVASLGGVRIVSWDDEHTADVGHVGGEAVAAGCALRLELVPPRTSQSVGDGATIVAHTLTLHFSEQGQLCTPVELSPPSVRCSDLERIGISLGSAHVVVRELMWRLAHGDDGRELRTSAHDGPHQPPPFADAAPTLNTSAGRTDPGVDPDAQGTRKRSRDETDTEDAGASVEPRDAAADSSTKTPPTKAHVAAVRAADWGRETCAAPGTTSAATQPAKAHVAAPGTAASSPENGAAPAATSTKPEYAPPHGPAQSISPAAARARDASRLSKAPSPATVAREAAEMLPSVHGNVPAPGGTVHYVAVPPDPAGTVGSSTIAQLPAPAPGPGQETAPHGAAAFLPASTAAGSAALASPASAGTAAAVPRAGGDASDASPAAIATATTAAAAPPRSVRKSTGGRKSFSRKSLEPAELQRVLGPPQSPCGRTERAGTSADPKAAILGLQANAAAVQMTLRHPDGNPHATILTDGTVLRPDGGVWAYIEADGSVGSAAMEYIGQVGPEALQGSQLITDADERPIATLDCGLVSIKDMEGSTMAEFDRNGGVKGHRGMACGRLEGFTYTQMHVAAALIALVCRDFVTGY